MRSRSIRVQSEAGRVPQKFHWVQISGYIAKRETPTHRVVAIRWRGMMCLRLSIGFEDDRAWLGLLSAVAS